MDRKDLLASILVDEAIAASMVPWACPCHFGPEGRYRLQELVGVGRNSLVYRAHDRLMSSEGYNATVAVKIMKSAAVEREALTVRRVSHDHVLRVSERGVDPASGVQFLVMEYVEGGDLSKAEVPWDVKRAVRFMVKVARGVHAAHSASVVHCDLKPANILLTAEGEPKVSDFDLSASVLNPGTAVRGNYAFMSPEQYAGEVNALSPPSDVYALGGLLYYLLTGDLPNGTSHAEVAGAHLQGVAGRKPLPKGDLAAIVQRAMARDRDARHNSAGEFAEDLERWLRREPIPWLRSNPVKRTAMWCVRKPLHATGVAVALVAVCAGVWLKLYLGYKELERDRQAQAEAERLFKVQKEEAADRVVAAVENTMTLALGTPSSDRIDRLLPMLVFIDVLAGLPVLDNEHRVAISSQRVLQLQAELASLKNQGRGEHMDACLVRYALAYFLVNEGRGADALLVIPEIESLLLPRLAEGDPVRDGVAAMRLCAECLENPLVDAPDDTKLIRDKWRQLGKQRRNEPVRRLMQRVIKQLEPRVKLASGEGGG
ncbi:MAG TPA: serine/threonine-protein kinase [Phycisphaerales bacterium]|nr:serine/threonine-protein kinase [Phycisphaerales bacterium]